MKKLFVLLIATTTLVACGQKVEFKKIQGEPGEDCSVVEALNGAQITCGTTTVFIPVGPGGLDGLNGQDGSVGSDGQDGSSCTVTSVPEGALITCTDGTSALVTNGSNGKDGKDNKDGKDANPTDGNNGTGNDDKEEKEKDNNKDGTKHDA